MDDRFTGRLKPLLNYLVDCTVDLVAMESIRYAVVLDVTGTNHSETSLRSDNMLFIEITIIL